MIGLNSSKLKMLKRVVEITAEEEGHEIRRFFSQILEQPQKEKAILSKKSFSASSVQLTKEND